jgi:hypothetical protein
MVANKTFGLSKAGDFLESLNRGKCSEPEDGLRCSLSELTELRFSRTHGRKVMVANKKVQWLELHIF